jgi:hypothetical protein
LALALVIPITVAIVVFDFHGFATDRISEISSIYPEELVLTLEDGELSINQPLPYRIEFPSEWKEFMEMNKDLEIEDINVESLEGYDLIMFARDSDIDASDLSVYKSIIIAGETKLYVYNPDEYEINIIPYDDFEIDFVLTHEEVSEGFAIAQEVALEYWVFQKWFYVPLLALMFFGGIYSAFIIGRLVQIFFFALVAWIICLVAFSKKGMKYWETYRLSFHSLTPVVVLMAVLSLIEYSEWDSLFSFGIYLIWTIVVISKLPNRAKKVK